MCIYIYKAKYYNFKGNKCNTKKGGDEDNANSLVRLLAALLPYSFQSRDKRYTHTQKLQTMYWWAFTVPEPNTAQVNTPHENGSNLLFSNLKCISSKF